MKAFFNPIGRNLFMKLEKIDNSFRLAIVFTSFVLACNEFQASVAEY